MTGNAVGLSAEELASLKSAERVRLREHAVVELREADMVVDSIADLPGAIAGIDALESAPSNAVSGSSLQGCRPYLKDVCARSRRRGPGYSA